MSASKRGELVVDCQGDEFYFNLKLKNGLTMCKSGYGTLQAAETGGNKTAKFYGIDLTPPKHSNGKGVARNR